ncbi:MAG: ATP-dependent DNA ligase, partial [Candidatus Eremiobacteraeota bacterium]|nr:ATP-dependent DNA ligase [Candidatus Eremiobacteraeota bacterium]
DTRRLAIGARTLIAAARRVWQPSDAALAAAFHATGDLGEALGRLVCEPRDLGLFAETLTPSALAAILHELASASGKAAGRRREAACERIFRACRDPREVAYAAKILLGELRIGLREGLVLEAIASAFAATPADVRRAAMGAGDVGEVAAAAQKRRLHSLAIAYGKPIGFMLATPLAFGSAYRELGDHRWIAEDKYDGVRAQAHVHGGQARLFSRTFSDASRTFPEPLAALAGGRDAIYDGEIVARRNGDTLPFRYLQPRLGRADPSPELREQIPVTFVAFDILAAGERFVLDEPLAERRKLLEERLHPARGLDVAPASLLETGTAAATIEQLFEEARARGHEGLMLKRFDSPYAPGRRGKWWLKLKRELATLDAVVVAVEWGHGKRKGVLSDYTFAVRRSAQDGELLPIGKAYSGLTDAEIGELTTWFLAHPTASPASRTIAVEPRVVVEIAFDIIAKSTLHRSGFALRFPRIVRLRPDKSAADIDTLADVERIYRDMLARERVER